jgi:hypothetical protein
MVEKTETIVAILEDIRLKYEAAMAGKDRASQEINTVQGAKNLIKAAIDQVAKDLERDCRALKSLCKGFNLVDELAFTIGNLRQEAALLQSLEARNQADAMIRSLEALIDGLNRQNIK